MGPVFWIIVIACAIIAPPSIPVLICSAIGYGMWQSRQDKKEELRRAMLDPNYLQDLANYEAEKERLGL